MGNKKIMLYELEKLQDELAKLDVDYLLGKVERKSYLKKRLGLKKIFEDIKKDG